MDTGKLIEQFDLQKDVDAFVVARVAEKAQSKTNFHFSGGNHTSFCEIKGPHIPHVLSSYSTHHFGSQEHFCLGKEGEFQGGTLTIVRQSYSSGDAAWPGHVKGFWYIH